VGACTPHVPRNSERDQLQAPVRPGPRIGPLAGVVLGCLVGLAASAGRAGATEAPKLPSLAPVVDKASREVTNCSTACWLRNGLTTSNQSLAVALRHIGPPGNAAPVAARLVLQGAHHGEIRVFRGKSVTVDAAGGAETEDTISVELINALPPDHYTGALLMDVSTGADQVVQPVDIQVRAGPFWPLMLLIGAVVAGGLITWLLSMRPKVQFRNSADRLRARIDNLPESERSILLPLWNETWRLRTSAFATAQTQLAALEAGADALRECRNVQDDAMRLPGALSLTPWLQRIGTATEKVVDAVRSYQAVYGKELARVTGSIDEFKDARQAKATTDALERRARPAHASGPPYAAFRNAVEAVRKALEGASPDPAQPAPDLGPLLRSLRNAFEKLEEAHGQALPDALPGAPVAAGVGAGVGVVTTILGWPAPVAVAGARDRPTRFDFTTGVAALIGPLASVAVAVVLLAVGFKTTYVDNATFGATLADWLTLVFWGLAAWGARQALTGLGKPAAASTG